MAASINTSLALDPSRIVTIAAFAGVEPDGILVVGASRPDSARFRSEVRPHLVEWR